jgi:hypothetical protein
MSWTRESDGARTLIRGARCAGVAVLMAFVGHAPSAFAQSTADAATAEALFNEAKKLSDAGDYAAACPKLAESQRLDPGGGTLTALAACHESQGKTASAWAEFIQVASDARQARRADREKFARQHIAALEPKLSKLTLVVDPATQGLSGLEVHRDDIVIGRAAWGTPVPVDPGDHAIEARAKGKQTWSTHVTVGDSADMQTVTVPALDDAPAPVAPVVAPTPPTEETDENKASKPSSEEVPPADASSGSGQRVAGIVVGSVGLGLVVVGSIFGASALSSASSANQLCPNSTCSNGQGVNDESSAKSAALLSDVMFGGAIVAVAVGVVLYVTAPRASKPPPPPATEGFVPMMFARGGGAGYTVRW